MKILCVSHGKTLRAGAELAFLELVEALFKNGHSVHAVVPGEGEMTERLRQWKIPVIVILSPWWVGSSSSFRSRLRRLWNLPFAVLRLYKILRQIHPDIVITNTMTIPAAAMASFLCRIPHVWYIHEFGVEDHRFRFDFGLRCSFFLIERLSERILLNSHTLEQHFRHSFSENKMSVIYYGIDVKPDPEFKPVRTEGSFRLILLGRITESKGQADAIRAIWILKKRGLPVQLILLGTPEPRYGAYLKKLEEELAVADRLHWEPFTQRPFHQMLSCDVALLCSKQEAFARVVIEAMKLGLPVIGSAGGGTPEQIRVGLNGLLYRSGDAEDLADKIEQLYTNRSLANDMGKNAQQWSESIFRPERYREELDSILKKTVSKLKSREQEQQWIQTQIGE
jgi:glycosyltransferase involved in cell wall biosynthesis